MNETSDADDVADAGRLESRLATLYGFRKAAKEELAAAGGIDPELAIELRNLDEAISRINVLLYQARGNKIKKGGDKRERCQVCNRQKPANHHNTMGDDFSQEVETSHGEGISGGSQQQEQQGGFGSEDGGATENG
jgi:hypothetical protein